MRMLHPVSFNVNYIKGPSSRVNGILPSFNRVNIQPLYDRVKGEGLHLSITLWCQKAIHKLRCTTSKFMGPLSDFSFTRG